jgi:hypothetical protein
MIEKNQSPYWYGNSPMKTNLTRSFFLLPITALLLAAVMLTACAPAAPQPIQTAPVQAAVSDANNPATQTTGASAGTSAEHPSPTNAATEITNEAEPLPYNPDATHLAPEDWRDWPIVPELSERARVIYQRGLAMGTDPQAFSKVGDCQSIKEVLLGMYDQPGNYVLRDEDQFLQETIDHFSGSFDRNGMAVKGGFNAASVLSPLWADPENCQAGENPIECEIRIHKPTFVIISLEVWWEGRSVERYEEYMRRIIEYSIDHGAVPILSTKADNVEGDHSINLATARLAYEYDLPLWNFWLAAQGLPNRGLDPDRPDGFHLSRQAWNERSYTALKTLDHLWRSANAEAVEAPVIAATKTSAAGMVSTATLPEEIISLDALQDLRASGNDVLVFGVSERQGEDYVAAGVFLFDFTAQQLHRLLPVGYDLQDVSPNGAALLVNQGSQLFVLELTTLEQIFVTDMLHRTPDPDQITALWLEEDSFALITTADDIRQIHIVGYTNDNMALTVEWQWINAPVENPISLVKSGIANRIVWESGNCSPAEGCSGTGFWATLLDMDESMPLEAANLPYFSSSAGAYVYGSEASTLMMYTLDGALRRELPLPGNAKWEYYLADAAWSADGGRLALQVIERSNYTGKQFNVTHYLLTPANWGIQELATTETYNATIRWSPDEESLILSGTVPAGDGYALSLSRLNPSNRSLTTYNDALNITAPDYLTFSRLGWLVAGE